MTMLNDTFERELALADEGYESGSETSNLPTPVRWTSRIHHVPSDENISFDPSAPHTTATNRSNCNPVSCHLSFSSSDDKDDSTSLPLTSMGIAKSPTMFISTTCADSEEEEEEQEQEQEQEEQEQEEQEQEDNFQTVALDDYQWITDPVPDRYLCLHEHSQPHSLCCYPCPYMDSIPALYQDTLDLSDISDFKDVMTISSDKDIPALGRCIWKQTMVCINIYILNQTCTHIRYFYHYMLETCLLYWMLLIGYFYNYVFMTCLLYLMPQYLNKC